MQVNRIKYALCVFSSLLLIIGCSSSTKIDKKPDKILQAVGATDCYRGFIRPPGVKICLNIDAILANEIEFIAPNGQCPVDWKRQSKNGFCLPAFKLETCTNNSFACNSERGDTFRIVREPTVCKNGTITVTGSAPRFDTNGELYLGTVTTLACGPIGRTEPD